MPGGDGTGPGGMGPMTGRAAGYCAGYGVPGFMNAGFGARGGWGGGWGRRNWFYATGLTGWQRAGMGVPGAYGVPAYGPPVATAEQQVEALKAQAKYFEDALAGIRDRIQELESQASKDAE